jgi:hypothetical protein
MEFIIDAGVFYEFQPIDNPTERPRAPWEVEAGETYALIITSVNGLARYAIGDTVTITSVQPLKFVISGRTRLFINAFGEELMVSNAEEAMARTTAELHCHVANYTAAPIYADDNSHGRHQWLIEFDGDVPPTDLFSATLDRHLCEVNSDYQAKRSGSIFLDAPQIVVAPHGLFVKWLAATGKVGGQRKVPRLCPDRHIIESMLAMI